MSLSDDRSFTHERLIDAPPERVYAALADPARLSRWWGPDGFTNTFEQFELRPGGRWRFTMHGPDGTAYPNENVFVEIVPARRVVIDHPAAGHHFVLTITLEPQGAQTRVGWRQVFDDAAHAQRLAPLVVPANEQNLARWAREVAA